MAKLRKQVIGQALCSADTILRPPKTGGLPLLTSKLLSRLTPRQPGRAAGYRLPSPSGSGLGQIGRSRV